MFAIETLGVGMHSSLAELGLMELFLGENSTDQASA